MSSAVESSDPVRQGSGPELSDSGTPRRDSARPRRQTLESWEPNFQEATDKVEKPGPIRSITCKRDANINHDDAR
jgi:hypothetical protein